MDSVEIRLFIIAGLLVSGFALLEYNNTLDFMEVNKIYYNLSLAFLVSTIPITISIGVWQPKRQNKQNNKPNPTTVNDKKD